MHRIFLVFFSCLVALSVSCSEEPGVDPPDEETPTPATWPEGYEPHVQSDECLDRYSDYHAPGTSWQMIANAHQSANGPPRCIRDEDGLGGYCTGEHEEGEPSDFYYFYCSGPESTNPDTGETVTREEPCLWLMRAVEGQGGECEYEVVCVPEDRLVEFNWPEDAGFEYRIEMGLTYC